jgi:hypothetical protein
MFIRFLSTVYKRLIPESIHNVKYLLPIGGIIKLYDSSFIIQVLFVILTLFNCFQRLTKTPNSWIAGKMLLVICGISLLLITIMHCAKRRNDKTVESSGGSIKYKLEKSRVFSSGTNWFFNNSKRFSLQLSPMIINHCPKGWIPLPAIVTIIDKSYGTDLISVAEQCDIRSDGVTSLHRV